LELTQSLEREMELNAMKSRFVSMASHEFRTPLSTVLSSAYLIEQYAKSDQEDNRKKHTEKIKSSVKNLIDILNDFLSLDKLEQGKVEIIAQHFDLKQLIEDIVAEVNTILKPGQHIKCIFDGSLEIHQDRKVLRHVIQNLLSNAIKYSQDEIKLNVAIRNEIVYVEVKDRGIGIPEDQQKFIFTKFFRSKNATNVQGTGLGLNIVKNYIELLNGSISFKSKPKDETSFFVSFPKSLNVP
jgi:signal transduction histidine kinase